MNLTEEQIEIVAKAKEGKNLAIKAFAGSGKTSTLVLIAKEVKKPSLYVAFNKSIAEEATGKFPFHVDCRTIHSLAYGEIIKPNYSMKGKLQNWLDKSDINLGTLESTTTAFSLKQTVVTCITEFCQSSSLNIEEFIKEDERFDGLDSFITDYWANLINPKSKVKISPDVYLKLYQLSIPKIDTSVIYFDEFQDSNPVTLDIVLKQSLYGTQIVLVGDSHQAIYAWRGAKDGFKSISDSFETLFLTESFRFTKEIADKANKLLSITGETNKIVSKREKIDLSEVKIDGTKRAILCRTNSLILSYLLETEKTNRSLPETKHEKVYCLADLKDLWSKLYHISSLYFKQPVKFPNAELARIKSYEQLKAEAEHDSNIDRLIKLSIALSQDGGLHTNINRIKSILVETPEEASFTLSTVHKSKGLEWDIVNLAVDCFYVPENETRPIGELLAENQTLNLLYVAITRGKYSVTVPDLVSSIINNNLEYKSDYVEAIRKQNEQ